MEKITPILIFGPPGSGKSIQAENVADKFGLPYISTGELIKEYTNSSKNDSTVKEAKKRYQEGQPQPNDLVFKLIRERLNQLELSKARAIILDNFPFNKDQFKWWQDFSVKNNFAPLRGIYLDVSEDTIYKRLKSRKRSDDNKEVVANRIAKYRQPIDFLRNTLDRKGNLVIVDGEPSINKVSKKVTNTVDEIIN